VELVDLMAHKNAWFSRTARRLSHERAQTQNGVAKNATEKLSRTVETETNATVRLNALWTLYLANALTDSQLHTVLQRDADPFVRGWAVQLAVENGSPSTQITESLIALAKKDPSPVVRRYLASAIHRLPKGFSQNLVEILACHGEDKNDRNLPYLLWHGTAKRWTNDDLEFGLALARTTRLPQLREWIYWYAATLEGDALNRVVALLNGLEGEALHRRLAGLWLAMEPRANVAMPESWRAIAPKLYASKTPQVQRLAESLAAAFGDATAFPRLRDTS